jgi:hypothetical protein
VAAKKKDGAVNRRLSYLEQEIIGLRNYTLKCVEEQVRKLNERLGYGGQPEYRYGVQFEDGTVAFVTARDIESAHKRASDNGTIVRIAQCGSGIQDFTR